MSNPNDGAPPAGSAPTPPSPAPGSGVIDPPGSAPPAAGTPPAPGAGEPPAGATPPAGADPSLTKGPWGDNWREIAAAEDAETLKRLQRYASPKDVAKALKEAQDKIRSGEMAAPLPENPTEDQVKEYRERNGIPAAAEGYLEKLPDGLVIGEDDKPLFTEFAKQMHQYNLKPDVVQGVLKWYHDMTAAADKERVDADGALKVETEKTLRDEWGGDFIVNLNVANAMLAQAPQAVQDMLADARLPDGTPLKGTADFSRWLVSLGREINPIVTLGGGRSGNPMQALHDEISSIEEMIQKDSQKYFGNPKYATRLAELYDIRDNKLKKAG